jgi:hypothetical protein
MPVYLFIAESCQAISLAAFFDLYPSPYGNYTVVVARIMLLINSKTNIALDTKIGIAA